MRTWTLALILFSSLISAAQEISVAAASDLQFALQDVKERFEKETGNRVQIVLGSSGNLFTQIQNGAPFDVFFSADIEYPEKLEAAGLAEPGTLYQYAKGKLVLWAPKNSVLDLNGGLPVLLDPRIKKIAIANPAHAPYGRAAVAALRHEGIYDKVADRLVLGENISQTASFVVSGAADVGLVALSLAVAPSLKDKGKYTEIPANDYPPIRQAAIVLKSSKQRALAQEFLAYLKRPATVEILKRYGFSIAADEN
jgi:molybdate transport system substrate-binding protein